MDKLIVKWCGLDTHSFGVECIAIALLLIVHYNVDCVDDLQRTAFKKPWELRSSKIRICSSLKIIKVYDLRLVTVWLQFFSCVICIVQRLVRVCYC